MSSQLFFVLMVFFLILATQSDLPKTGSLYKADAAFGSISFLTSIIFFIFSTLLWLKRSDLIAPHNQVTLNNHQANLVQQHQQELFVPQNPTHHKRKVIEREKHEQIII